MRIYTLLLFCILSNVANASELYKTYIQINSSTKQVKLFVLAMLVPISGNEEDDRAMKNFTLSLGESQTKVFLNKNYPNREYVINVQAWDNEYEKMGVTVNFEVLDSGKSVYQSEQVVGAWQAFNKNIQQNSAKDASSR